MVHTKYIFCMSQTDKESKTSKVELEPTLRHDTKYASMLWIIFGPKEKLTMLLYRKTYLACLHPT
jgi:hypothetical protein